MEDQSHRADGVGGGVADSLDVVGGAGTGDRRVF